MGLEYDFDIVNVALNEIDPEKLGSDSDVERQVCAVFRDIRTADAWSTLGVFNDPILSNLLNRSVGSLADVIIHEMTHSTIFVKDSLEFNENLASFIGEKGSMEFLEMKFGPESEVYIGNHIYLQDKKKFYWFVINSTKLLDSLYSNFPNHIDDSEKAKRKESMLIDIIEHFDTISFSDHSGYKQYFENYIPNNTFFMSFLRYRGNAEKLDSLLNNKFEGDLRVFIEDMKQKFAK